jgi:hypothetical protein
MSSNAPSFSNSSGNGPSSASSSATVTPSASPQASNAPLPNTLSSYTAPPPQHQQQQQSYGSLNAGAATGGGQQHIYPALHLHPLNDTFIPKQISLYPPGPNNRIKIGRQTNAKTVPAPNNGYFDSKVLSRMHAEVWAEGSKVSYIPQHSQTASAKLMFSHPCTGVHQGRQVFQRYLHQRRTSIT